MDRPRPVDRQRLDTALARLRDGSVDDLTVTEAVERILESSARVFGLSGAGLMVLDEDEALAVAAATDDPGRLLESVQEEIGEGPCVDTLHLDRVVTTEDVRVDERWPQLRDRLADQPVAAVLGVPVRLAGSAVAALNLYHAEPRAWSDADADALYAFGQLLEALLATAVTSDRRDVTVQQLQGALDNRVPIERAVGLLMERHRLNPVDAFNRLRHVARSQRRLVVEVAEDLLAEVIEG